jgi:hypothetical protein
MMDAEQQRVRGGMNRKPITVELVLISELRGRVGEG